MLKKLNITLLYLIFLPGIVFGQSLINVPTNPYKAPLYWSVYEYHIIKELGGDSTNYISEDVFLKNINFVEQHLKPYGYDMVAIDGWGDEYDSSTYNEYGYRSKHSLNWTNDYSWWANELQERGMNLGIYQNPLWVNLDAVDDGLMVKGTSIPLSQIIDTTETTKWFTWVQVDSTGAEEYVKGYVQHFADMGVKYLRVDFLSWFEEGYDKNYGTVGPDRSREDYITAMEWIKEACDANDIFLSAVMPSLNNEAEVEIRYSHMFRVNEDVFSGGWERFSELQRGVRRSYWSEYANTFDGYVYWSHLAGRDSIILDGDFIRLNTMANDHEKRSVISLHLMAGGPLSPADQYNTIGSDLKFYQNIEMLELNYDGFVGKPLTNDPTDTNSQIWKGQMSDGDWVVALFNREDTPQTRSVNFSTDLGISTAIDVRDLWEHSDLGSMTSYSETIPAHGVTVLRIGNLADNDSTYTNTGEIEVGTDDSSNYDSWVDESNGGTGFGNWIFGGNATGRAGLASSQDNGGSSSIDVEGNSFYLSDSDNSNSYIDIFRYMIHDLQPGQSFTIEMDVNWRGGYKGINIRGADDNTSVFKFEVGNQGSGDDYVVQNVTSGGGSIGNSYSDNTQFTITLSQTSASGGSWTITRTGGVADSDSGTYTGTVSSIQLYTFLSGSDSQQAIYYNSMSITNTDNDIQLSGDEGWRLLTVPISGQSFENLLEPIWTQGVSGGTDTPNGTPNVYVWDVNASDNTNTNWMPVQDLGAEINPGTGFLVYVFEDDNNDGSGDGFPKTLSLSGTENNIDISPTINNGDSAWTLLGNPFSTAIDFDNSSKNQLTDVAYIWDPAVNNWISWNGTSGSLTDGVIKPYQGFFVQNDGAVDNQSISFSSSKSSGGSFYGKQATVDVSKVELRISGNELENSFWLQFSEEGDLNKAVRGDALKLQPLSGPYVQLSSRKSDDQLDIMHLPDKYSETHKIPLFVEATQNGVYNFSFNLSQFKEQFKLFLEDTETGQIVALGDGGNYSFEIDEVSRKKVKGLSNLVEVPIKAKAEVQARFYLIIDAKQTVQTEVDTNPLKFTLDQNFPNPFNPTTRINYSLKTVGKVNLTVYSIDGRKVAELINSVKNAGKHSVVWNASGLSSGVYIYRLTSSAQSITRKMILLK